MADALYGAITTLPTQLTRSLTWATAIWTVFLSLSDMNGNAANPRGIAYISVRTMPAPPTAPNLVTA